MSAGVRLPLRVLLPLLAVGLAAAGASAVGLAEVSAARAYLMRQVDQNLVACAAGPLSHPVEAVPGSAPDPGSNPGPASGADPGSDPGPASGADPALVLPGPCDAELLTAGGQLLTPAVPGAPPSRVLSVVGAPASRFLPVGGSRSAARPERPVTVAGTGGGGWRVIVASVHYQPRRIMYVYGPDDVMYVIGGRTGPVGLLVVMTGLTRVGQVTGRVAAGYAAAAGAVLVALAGAALALVRAVLRPRRPAAGLAATGEPGRPQPISAAEAVARRSTAEMAARLGEVALDLRTSVNVVRGFAEYCRQRRPRPSAGLDRMVGRVAEEVARMETLIDRLGPSASPSRAEILPSADRNEDRVSVPRPERGTDTRSFALRTSGAAESAEAPDRANEARRGPRTSPRRGCGST